MGRLRVSVPPHPPGTWIFSGSSTKREGFLPLDAGLLALDAELLDLDGGFLTLSAGFVAMNGAIESASGLFPPWDY